MTDVEKLRRMEQNLLDAEKDAARRQENADRLRAELTELREKSVFDARHRVLDASFEFQDNPSARAARRLAEVATAYAALTQEEDDA